MVDCYCRANHGCREALCPECQGLLDYARLRLERCRFGLQKPVCAKCHDIQVSGTLGMSMSGGMNSDAGNAIAVSGIRRWLRRAKGQ